MTKLVDMKGNAFHEQCKVARAVISGATPFINICVVTKIANGHMYLDNSKTAIRFPNRLLIIEQDPLHKMVSNYDKTKDK